MDPAAAWSNAVDVSDFAQRLASEWTDDYVSQTSAALEDLVDVDPGNGFHYTFDLAGSLRGVDTGREPRVVGVWGFSVAGSERDRVRMRGHPRSGRPGDDRGHLVACAAGGGYDVNLVPMDAALNRGRSSDGARFRALEQLAASLPGSLYFVRLAYEDGTARPSAFEVGVAVDGTLVVETFLNGAGDASTRPGAALRAAAPFPFDAELVTGCLDLASPPDRVFARAWEQGCGVLSTAERAVVAGVTGHVAESLCALFLANLDWSVLWHFTGPGRHGVDLVLLSPDERVVVVEVKGTLVPGRIPRLSRRDVEQMSAAWVDKHDNPGMYELGLESVDVFGAVAVVNVADGHCRAAFTADFEGFRPVVKLDQLPDLGWLEQ